jgi:hypothetical protein
MVIKTEGGDSSIDHALSQTQFWWGNTTGGRAGNIAANVAFPITVPYYSTFMG